MSGQQGIFSFFGDSSHPGQFIGPNTLLACSSFCIYPSVVIGDFNQDGVADLAFTTSDPPFSLEVGVFIGDASNPGNFLPSTTYDVTPVIDQTHGSNGIGGLVMGDFNGDGVPDLATLWYAYGNSGFEPVGWHVSPLMGNPNNPGQFVLASDTSSPINYVSVGSFVSADFIGNGLSDLAFGLAVNDSSPTVQVLLDSPSATATAAGIALMGSSTQSVVASYAGDSDHQASASAAPVATNTTLTTSAFISNVDTPIVFTAAVTYVGSPVTSGSITFYDGTQALATVGLSAQGTATYTATNSFTVGTHTISAAYALNGTYLPSTSATLTITVTQTGQTPAGGGLLFVPITPCRLMDTRGNGFSGAFGAPSLGDAERDVPVPQSACGIPGTALAYSLNVTAVPQGLLGYLSVWPTGLVQPTVSTLNSYDGRVVANAAIVPAGADGSIALYASNTTDAVVDINGYFVSEGTPGGLAFYPVTPCRVADTRGNGFSGSFGQPTMTGGSSRSFPIQQSTCGIPATAQA
ncbi:MAG: Ig-like domain repeat protein [Bryobacteraceae bacterium]